MIGSSIAVNSVTLDKHINASDTVDNLIASNTGPSGLISDDGKIIELLNSNTEQNVVVFPNFSSEKTFYTKFGERPLLLLFLFFMLLNFFV